MQRENPLFDAALLSEKEALAQWETLRPDSSFLLAPIYDNLKHTSADLRLCKSVFRHAWTQNQQLLFLLQQIEELFVQQKIPSQTIGKIALVQKGVCTRAHRIDLLLPCNKFARFFFGKKALPALRSLGWKKIAPFRFSHPKGALLCLHPSFFHFTEIKEEELLLEIIFRKDLSQIVDAALLLKKTPSFRWDVFWKKAKQAGLTQSALFFFEQAGRYIPWIPPGPFPPPLPAPSLEKQKALWAQNQHLLQQILPLLSLFQKEGISPLVPLKGMALCLGGYLSFALREMGDFDLLIPEESVPRALEILFEKGWHSTLSRLNCQNKAITSRWHGANLFHIEQKVCLDLHWRPNLESSPEFAKEVLDQAIPHPTLPLSMPEPWHLFWITCLHGAKASPVSLIRWVDDAMALLEKSPPWDWNLFVEKSLAMRVHLFLHWALSYLRTQRKAPIPLEVIETLQNKESPLLRKEFFAHANQKPFLAAWYRSRIERRSLRFYLIGSGRLASFWQIPLYAPYWALKKILRKIPSSLRDPSREPR